MSEDAPKTTLFDLHRAIERHSISDGDLTVEFGLRSPSHADSVNVLEQLADKRDEIENSDGAAKLRKEIVRRADDMPMESLLLLIMTLEEPTVLSNLDLSPAPGESSAPDEETEEQIEAREKAAMARWNTQRRSELGDMPLASLRALYVELQTRIAIQSQALSQVQLAELVLMVIDPETRKPLFSMNTKAENFIGHLAPETIQALGVRKSEFIAKRTEQKLREAAERNGPFSRSGVSRRRRRASRGATTSTPPTSTPTPSDSSAVASG